MKKTLTIKSKLQRLAIALGLSVLAQTLPAQTVLLSDDFNVTANSNDPNLQLKNGRQSGVLAPARYTGWQNQHQVGNTTTDVGQPGGATNSNYVLLAFDGCFFSDLNVCSASTGPLTIQFDMYLTGANNPNTDPTTWAAFTLSQNFNNASFPIVGAGEFGFLARVNGGAIVWQNGGEVTPSWDTPGFATNTHWQFVFSDPSGTNSAFNGNGSQVTVYNGGVNLGTVALSQLNSEDLRMGFRDIGNRFAGIANLSVTGTPGPLPGQNLSFEYDATPSGTSYALVPASWTPFSENGPADIGSQNAGGTDYSVFDPLAPTASGNQYCYVNMFNPGVTGGLYQDFGPMQTNTVYTLTVAIGSRADRINSPGIISLVNGTDNTGVILATGGGLPASQDSWQDYSVTFTNGSTASGDLTVVLSATGGSTIQANFDNVRLTTAPFAGYVPPTLIKDVEPMRSEVVTGGPVTLSVNANGSVPLHFQWYNQGGPISGATNSAYSFNAVAGTNDYYVQVSNPGGSVTSSTAVVFSATNFVTVNNFSFENGTTGSGFIILPLGWSPYNDNNFCTVVNNGFSQTDPLAPTADANDYFAVNEGPGDPTGGIYQDVGALLPNTTYTLTAAIGLSVNFGPGSANPNLGSPGIISLINGTDPTGLVLATTNGLPATSDTWQDFSVTFTTGGVVSGDLVVELSTAGASTYQAAFDNVRLTKAAAVGVVAPTILLDNHPIRSEVTTGGPVNLSVIASGSLPLSYQWFNDSGPIGGATNSAYSFNAVAGTNSYYLVVTNAGGSVTSATAVVISAPNLVTVNNFSFENGTTGGGNSVVPVSWTAFNDNNFSTVANNSYSQTDPLASPADGNDFFAINEGPSDPTGGIYQDVGPLQPNTTYTLTVAVGLRADFAPGNLGSPGIISLINGVNTSGTVLATTSGVPNVSDTWQDYSVSYTTGRSVSGDLTIELSVAGASTYQANFDNVQLTTVPVLTAPTLGASRIIGGNLILTGTGGTANQPYSLLSTTNLTPPIVWITNATGTLTSAGAFSNSVPVSGTNQAQFFQVVVP
jgi:hypothetical protein